MDRDRLSPSSYTQIKSPKRRSVDYNEKLQKSNLASTTINKPLNIDKAKLIEKEGVEIGQVRKFLINSDSEFLRKSRTTLVKKRLGKISSLYVLSKCNWACNHTTFFPYLCLIKHVGCYK